MNGLRDELLPRSARPLDEDVKPLPRERDDVAPEVPHGGALADDAKAVGAAERVNRHDELVGQRAREGSATHAEKEELAPERQRVADDEIHARAASSGRPILEKPFDEARLLAVVQEALAASQRSQQENQAVAGIAARLTSLTPREHDVLQRLVAGLPNKTIAYDLGTSPRTVEVQRARVMEKMGARSLAELVRMVLALERAGGKPKASA